MNSTSVPLQGATAVAHGDHKAGFWTLTIGSVGVVYGDIGTSPLYALREAVVAAVGNEGLAHRGAVLGVLSLILWALIIVVTLKYVLLLLRADNNGEGGTLALMALAQRAIGKGIGAVVLLGIISGALFYGDALITPALSVLSALEGLKIVTPHFDPYIVPLTVVVLIALFAAQSRGEDRVTMVFLGEGATETGVFYETVNFAALKDLPMVFLVENNFFSVYSPIAVRQKGESRIVDIAEAHGIPAQRADGNDVERVYDLSRKAVEKARKGGGPSLLEFITYRWREHCGPNYDNDIGYRTEAEYLAWKERCPVAAYERFLTREGIASRADLDAAMAKEKADRKSTRLNSSHMSESRMPSSA